MPNINNKHINFLMDEKLKQQSYIKQQDLDFPISPKIKIYQEFKEMSNHQRVQTARDYCYLIEKEPLFQSKRKLKPVSSESMFREALTQFHLHNGDSQVLTKIKLSQISQTPRINNHSYQGLPLKEMSQTSRVLDHINDKQSQFTDKTFQNQGFKNIWRDSSLDQATRSKIIEKLKDKKQQKDHQRQIFRSQQRSQKAQRIKSMMIKLDLRQKDIKKSLNFEQLPICQIQNELKDISILKIFINATIKAQSFCRMVIQKTRYQRIKIYYNQKVRYLQGFFRDRYYYKEFKKNFIAKRTKSVIVIQRYVRGFLIRLKNIIDVKRLQKLKLNLDFLDNLNQKQKAIQLQEQQEEEEKQRILRQQEEQVKLQQELENNLYQFHFVNENAQKQNLSKDFQNTNSPQFNRNRATSGIQRKLGRISIAMTFKKQKGEIQSMIVGELNRDEKLDLLNHNDDLLKESPTFQQIKKESKDNKVIFEELVDSEDTPSKEYLCKTNQKEITQDLHKYLDIQESALTLQDLRRFEQQENIPNYMKATVSNKCSEMNLDYEKVHEIKARNKVQHNLQNRQEIDQVIDLALEEHQRAVPLQRSQSRQSKFKPNINSGIFLSQNANINQERNNYSNNQFNVQNLDFEGNSKEIKLQFQKQSVDTLSPLIKSDQPKEESDSSDSQEDKEKYDHVDFNAEKIHSNHLDLVIQKQSRSEDKNIKRQVSSAIIANIQFTKADQSIQTSQVVEDLPIHGNEKIKKIQQESKEIQVELMKSKYNYLSTAIQLATPQLAQDIDAVYDQSVLTRGRRKSILRQNLVLDRFVQQSEIYERDPFRFKSHIIHNKEPFISETPGDILSQNFYTPNEFFFVNNHGPVPRLLEEEFSLYVLGNVHRPIRLTLDELKSRFPKANISVTLKSATSRKQEFDQVDFIDQNSQPNNKFGIGALGTAMWGGVRLRDILKMAQIDSSKSKFAEFYGEDIVYKTDSQNYSIALPIKICLDKKSDIILAYEMNGETLPRDHGFPLRLVCPGMIGAKSVKWLSRIMIIDSESPSHIQQYDFKLFPSNITSQSVGNQWQNFPSMTYLNIDCVFTNIQDGDVVPCDQRFVIKGYAIAGQGNQIHRVEITFDQGITWQQCKLTNFKGKKAIDMDESCRKWEWSPWEYVVDNGIKEDTWVMVRAFDECCNTQPELINMIWNFKGYMNNSIQKIKIYPQKVRDRQLGIKFAKKDQDKQVPSSATNPEQKSAIEQALEKDMNKNKILQNMDSDPSKKRWQKQSDKVEASLNTTTQDDEPVNRRNYENKDQDPAKICDEALELFLRGSFTKYDKELEKLELIKTNNIRKILNTQDFQMTQTKQDDFNEKFRQEMAGAMGMGEDDEEEKSDIEMEQNTSKNFKSQLSSGNMDHEMHKEMLIQKRNLLMKIRQNDSEFMKYDFKNESYDGQLIEKKMKKGQEERYEKREEKRQNKQATKHQRVLNKCSQCFYQEGKFDKDILIAESDSCYVAFPVKTSPVYPQGQETITHMILCPKQHFVNLLEVDEQVQTDLRNFQKSIVAFYLENYQMQTVFIETSIQSEHSLPHAQLDCIGIPNDLEMEFDLEVYFKKSLLDDDSEWGSHRKIIDTKEKKGMIWKCIPGSGVFNYVHIDFGGLGGFAHVIDDPKKYNATKALEVVAGAIGHEMVNLKIPLRREKAAQHAREIRRKFVKYDWTKTQN